MMDLRGVFRAGLMSLPLMCVTEMASADVAEPMPVQAAMNAISASDVTIFEAKHSNETNNTDIDNSSPIDMTAINQIVEDHVNAAVCAATGLPYAVPSCVIPNSKLRGKFIAEEEQ